MATAAAKRYARAVFELAREEDRVDEWQRHLASIRDLFSDAHVASVLQNPTIPAARRMELVAAPRFLDPEAGNLVRLLIESGRVDEIAGIADEFELLADSEAGRVRAVVTTAVLLSTDDRERLAKQLSQKLGEEVRLDAVVDEGILGGLKLQYGDHLIDASVATRLQQLRRRLAEAS